MNSKTRVLLISPFFYPEEISTGKYNSALASALVDADCHVTVICSHPLYPDWKVSETKEKLEGVEIIRGGLGVKYPRSAVLRRLVLEFWYMMFVVKNMRKMKNNIDIIVPIFPPTLYMILLKYFLPEKRFCVGIVHDLLGVMAKSQKSKLRDLISRLITKAEISAFNVCDQIVCLSESMKSTIHTQLKIPNEKLVVKYPFVSIGELKGNGNLHSIFPEQYIHIVYSGALGEKQIPNTLVNFFQRVCENDQRVMCHIFSRGPVFDQLSKRNGGLSDQLVFHDLVNESDLAELYERSAIQVIPQAQGTGAGAFPSKLPNLLAAGVPVFAICDIESELGKLVDISGVSYVVKDWSLDSWTDGMKNFILETQKETHRERQEKTKNIIAELFSVKPLVNTILNK